MSGLLDDLNIPPCFWFSGETRRNSYVAIISGVLFFLGWWILIDAASVNQGSILAGYHMCGVFGTLSLIMVNSVSNEQIQGENFDGGFLGPRGARIWLFLGFVMGFASIIASCWILFADFVAVENIRSWPGVALFLQNSFIFISNLIFKFGRTESMW